MTNKAIIRGSIVKVPGQGKGKVTKLDTTFDNSGECTWTCTVQLKNKVVTLPISKVKVLQE